jgi:gamma-glutamyltranspeptidase/glutathione hydrolase
MMLRSLLLGIICLVGLTISSMRYYELSAGPMSGGLSPDTVVGFMHDSRNHPHEPSRDNTFSMTINKYGIVTTLRTLASQASASILAKGGNALEAAIAANAAVGSEPMMNGLFAIIWSPKEKKLYELKTSDDHPRRR